MDGPTHTYSERFACPERRHLAARAGAAHLLVQLAARRLPALHRAGHPAEIDPELVVPDPTLSISQGALVPWTVINSSFYEQVIQAIAERYEIDLDTPVGASSRSEQRDLFLQGTGRREAVRLLPQPHGAQAQLHAGLRGHRARSRAALPRDRSALQKERIEEYMTLKPCPPCKGARLKRHQPGGHGRRPQHLAADDAFGRRARSTFVSAFELSDTERAIGARILKEIRERLSFLENVGVGYLTLDRAAATPVGRRGPADPAGHADRLEPDGRAVHPRRAVDRAAPARQRAAARDARAAARSRQHRDRGRARRGHDPGRRPHRRHGPGRRRARRARGRRGHGGAGDAPARSR